VSIAASGTGTVCNTEKSQDCDLPTCTSGGGGGGGGGDANTPPSKPTGVYASPHYYVTSMKINWASLGDNGSPSEITTTIRIYYQEYPNIGSI
jgi:hypothetical protein